MKESVLLNLSIEFATKILSLVKFLRENKETIISKQIGRSATSIGANIHEAQYGNSKADFIAKFHIALKEANETKYWLVLLNQTGHLPKEEFEKIADECEKIKAMLIKSLNTLKNK